MTICIDTNTPKRWNPFHVLAFGGIGLALLATAMLALIGACTGGSPPPPPTGTVSLAWSIFDATSQPATCDQVSARSVALRLRPRGSGNTVAAAMPCAPGSGTAPVAPGIYDIAIELHAADGTRLATAAEQTGITITAGRTTPLTAARFAANMTFRLVASIATSVPTNCQSTASGGAGITGTTVTLERMDPGREGCAAVTFSRAQGNTQQGTYTVNCSSPSVTTCIENNETLTASVPPGAYLIYVRGKRGAVDCWRANDKLTVSASSSPTLHTVALMHVNEPPC
jgi:hypothetical protein